MAKKKNPNNTVESVIGRSGIPRWKTVNIVKRCMGALNAVDGDIEQAVQNLTGFGSPHGAQNKFLKASTVRYHVAQCSRLPSSEQKRLSNMTADRIIESITRRKK
jgi:hypothetical protein